MSERLIDVAKRHGMTLTEALEVQRRRIWFYHPDWYFPRLSPVWLGSDDIGRRTLVIGWAVTGRVIIAFGKVGGCCDDGCGKRVADFRLAGSPTGGTFRLSDSTIEFGGGYSGTEHR